MYWAWSQGKAGNDFRKERDTAAAAGTLAHSLVFAHLHGQGLDELLLGVQQDIRDGAVKGFHNWLKWKQQTRLEIRSWEKPLICEHHRYGGTPDALATLDGLVTLADWKTSSGGAAYVEHLCQLAAYSHLFKDAGMTLGPGFHLCTFNRDTADFTHRYFDDLNDAWLMFLELREAYDLDRLLAKRVK